MRGSGERKASRAVVGDDQRLSRPRDARSRERREAPLGRPRARVPGGPHRRERPLERRLEPAVEPLDSLRLEERRPRLGRLDREPRVLEPPQHLLPGLLDPRRVLLDEHEPRAGRERLPEPHPRPHPFRLRRRGHRPEQRLGPGQRRECRRLGLEPRPQAQSGPQVEGRDDDGGDHGTYVLYEHTFSCQARVSRRQARTAPPPREPIRRGRAASTRGRRRP